MKSTEKSSSSKEKGATQTKSELTDSATSENKLSVSDSMILDLLDISTDESSETDCLLDIFSNAANGCKPTQPTQPTQSTTSNLLGFDFLKKIHSSSTTAAAAAASSSSSSTSSEPYKKGATNKSKMSDKKASAWMDLFADLDPLANPTTMEKKIAGANQNCLDA